MIANKMMSSLTVTIFCLSSLGEHLCLVDAKKHRSQLRRGDAGLRKTELRRGHAGLRNLQRDLQSGVDTCPDAVKRGEGKCGKAFAHCCALQGLVCYEKNEDWSSCRSECDPTVDDEWTGEKWNCKEVISGAPPPPAAVSNALVNRVGNGGPLTLDEMNSCADNDCARAPFLIVDLGVDCCALSACSSKPLCLTDVAKANRAQDFWGNGSGGVTTTLPPVVVIDGGLGSGGVGGGSTTAATTTTTTTVPTTVTASTAAPTTTTTTAATTTTKAPTTTTTGAIGNRVGGGLPAADEARCLTGDCSYLVIMDGDIDCCSLSACLGRGGCK